MSIRIVKFESGKRLPMLVYGHLGVPDGYVAAYLLSKNDRLTPATMMNKVLAVQDCMRFCRTTGIQDVHQLCKGEFLGDDHLGRLATHLEGDGPTPKSTAPAYYASFVDFLTWLARRNPRDGESCEACEGRITRFEERAKDHRPDPRKRLAVERLGLTEAQRDEFLRGLVALEQSAAAMSLRDFVLMYAAFQLGLRSGELLGLKVQDLERKDAEGKLRVVRRPNDPEDPRREPAAQKTAARTMMMSAELTKCFEELVAWRSSSTMARRHPYVLINVYGEPLSPRGLRYVYQNFRSRHPQLGGIINHMLRHDWNDRWNEAVRKHGWNLDRAVRLQRKLMGWSDTSTMVDVYGRRSLQDEADRAALALQGSILLPGGRR